MHQARSTLVLTRLVAYCVISYGLSLLASSLLHQLRSHPGHHLDILLISVPQVVGLGFTYLGSLLLRQKYTAWLAAMGLFGLALALDILHVAIAHDIDDPGRLYRISLPVLIIALLWLTRSAFQVRSDIRSFTQALRLSAVILLVAFLYGTGGFLLLDRHDVHHATSLPLAMHETIDQFGLTTDHPVAHTVHARLFLDSLSVISIAALAYAAISLFDPIRMRLVNQMPQRALAEQLLRAYPSDIDDYFKLWPYDKLYYFSEDHQAGVAYHVVRGVALVVGNPFGNPKQFSAVLKRFTELCFVNDWLPAFIHVSSEHRALYEQNALQLQQIGQEAVLDIKTFQAERNNKYFRQIGNRFTKLGYTAAVSQPPHSVQVMSSLRVISREWLEKPGRAERGFMLGYFNEPYLQSGPLVLLRDATGEIQGFMNLVPTFDSQTANYDLLRCKREAPGNANDFMMLAALDWLQTQSVRTFNLGLCPLSGLDVPSNDDSGIIDQTLRFVYANGDRLYSFSGLHRFKAKYQPDWEPRFIAYPGGMRNFTRTVTALNKAMKIT